METDSQNLVLKVSLGVMALSPEKPFKFQCHDFYVTRNKDTRGEALCNVSLTRELLVKPTTYEIFKEFCHSVMDFSPNLQHLEYLGISLSSHHVFFLKPITFRIFRDCLVNL